MTSHTITPEDLGQQPFEVILAGQSTPIRSKRLRAFVWLRNTPSLTYSVTTTDGHICNTLDLAEAIKEYNSL